MSLRVSFGPYNIFLVTDRSIYCHMTLSAMNYLLYKQRHFSRLNSWHRIKVRIVDSSHTRFQYKRIKDAQMVDMFLSYHVNVEGR
jgi:hypothetical protein